MTQPMAIVGDGQMGLVLAGLLAEKNRPVRLWGPFPDEIATLRRTRESPQRLPGFRLAEAVEVTADEATLLDDAEVVIHAIPTQFTRSVWRRLAPHLPKSAIVASVTKGIERETLLLPLGIVRDVLEREDCPAVCLSGPTIAKELARKLPATLLAASEDPVAAEILQERLSTDWFRVYTHDDAIGTEVAGAAKNVIALAAGMLDGLESGINAKSALLARGLAEIVRFGTAMGARQETFFGIAGVGDLATTCFSPFGRNRTCGERLARGEALETILKSSASVVEGIPTTEAILALARRHDVELPIAEAVSEVLFGDLPPSDALARLMRRDLKAERVG